MKSYHINVGGLYSPSLEGFTTVIKKFVNYTIVTFMKNVNELFILAREYVTFLFHCSLFNKKIRDI